MIFSFLVDFENFTKTKKKEKYGKIKAKVKIFNFIDRSKHATAPLFAFDGTL